jgi:hypothetical protein
MQIARYKISQLPLVALPEHAAKIREDAIMWVQGEFEDAQEDKAFIDVLNRHADAAWWESMEKRSRGSARDAWKAAILPEVSALLVERYPDEYEA